MIVRALRKARKTERVQSDVSEMIGTSYPSTDERSLDCAKLSVDSLLIAEPSCQAGLGEAELSSSQSSSIDPHTPSVHGDLSPHAFAEKLSVKDVFTVEADSMSVHATNEVSLGRLSPVSGDMQTHWSRLMSRLVDSDSPSLGTPQAVTPTPATSEHEFHVVDRPTLSNMSSGDSLSSRLRQGMPPSVPQQPIVTPKDVTTDLAKRTRQLQLLDAVLAEETVKQAGSTPPRSAHIFGRFPPPASTPDHPHRASSVNPGLTVSQYGPQQAVPGSPFYPAMGPYGISRPSTVLSPQPPMLSGTYPATRTTGADYLGHRGFSSTSSLVGSRQRGGNARLLSILNGEVGW